MLGTSNVIAYRFSCPIFVKQLCQPIKHFRIFYFFIFIYLVFVVVLLGLGSRGGRDDCFIQRIN